MGAKMYLVVEDFVDAFMHTLAQAFDRGVRGGFDRDNVGKFDILFNRIFGNLRILWIQVEFSI